MIWLRAAVVGIGFWGTRVAREYIALAKEGLLESICLCDADRTRLKPFVNACETFTDLAEVLKKVDMIHVCTPNSTHYEVTRKAFEMDVNVLVEKPMTEKVDHAFDLVELSMKKGTILQVGHVFRFANIVRKIKGLFVNKEFGEKYYFNFEWTHLMPPGGNVDVISDLLPHPLDIINFITGKWPISFKGIEETFRRNELPESAFLQAICDGFFANLHLSRVSPVRRRKLEIFGSEKSITADCVEQTAMLYEKDHVKDVGVDPNNTLKDEILNFMEAVRTGKSNFNPSVVGVRSVEAVEKARASVR
jgi:predicted dehydrogenase